MASTKLIAFADNNSIVGKMVYFLCERVENLEQKEKLVTSTVSLPPSPLPLPKPAWAAQW